MERERHVRLFDPDDGPKEETPEEPKDIAETAVRELHDGLTEIHQLLERLRNVIWQSRLKADDARQADRQFRKVHLKLEEDRGEDGLELAPDRDPREVAPLRRTSPFG